MMFTFGVVVAADWCTFDQ